MQITAARDRSMMNYIESAVPIAVGLVTIAVRADTVRYVARDSVPSLSRTSQRLVSRHDEPVGFWLTMFTGLTWLAIGLLLLVIVLGGALGMI